MFRCFISLLLFKFMTLLLVDVCDLVALNSAAFKCGQVSKHYIDCNASIFEL